METLFNLSATLKVGVLGLGFRGLPQLELLLNMPDVNVCAIYDSYEDRRAEAVRRFELKNKPLPLNAGDIDEFFNCEMDAVVIMTGWQSHIPLALRAMDRGIRVGLEVGGANSLQECFELVKKSEETGVPVMLLENCCYGEKEMALLNMIRKGLFGEIVHCEGAYAHDLRDEIGLGDKNRHYRQDNFIHRNGELYPTHELGPIFKYLNINRGNRLLSICSMASKARGLGFWLNENRKGEAIASRQVNQGDVVNSLIKCQNGETILLTHDCTLPRPYSRGGKVQGVKGIWQEDNSSIFIDGLSPKKEGYWTHIWESDEKYMQEFKHPLWQKYEDFGVQEGHGGMDFLVLRAFIDSIQRRQPFPIDVYDTASLMAITPLSEESISLGSQPLAIPDFTHGAYTGERREYEGLYKL